MTNFDLHRLASLGLVDDLKRAVYSGEDVNQKNDLGATALHYAISEKRPETASTLLDLGADACSQDKDGKTPLHWAIEHRLFDTARELIQREPQVTHIEDKYGNQPLWTAAFKSKGDYRFVELLLDNGAAPSHCNQAGLCPLDIPRRTGNTALLKLLTREDGR